MSGKDQTPLFLQALARELKPARKALRELDGLWGKGIRSRSVNKKVLDELRKRTEGLGVQLTALERLADGEVPE